MANIASLLKCSTWKDWLTLLTRLIAGIAFLWAGLTKIDNLQQSVVAVQAYQLPLADWMETAVGYAMPIVEIIVGLMLIVGLFTKFSAGIIGLAMVAYIIAISSAWARGLSIDCGCYSDGGQLAEGEDPGYLLEILRDLGFLICCVWAFIFTRPRNPVSVDGWLVGQEIAVED